MIKKTLLLLFLITTLSIHSQEWNQKKADTKVTFKIKNFGVNVDGDFSDIKIETNFNPQSLPQSYINATIAVKSIATGIESRDKHILEEDYFDVENHKDIVLKSTKIEEKHDGTFVLTGDLIIKGKTKQIVVLLTVSKTNSKLSFKSNFTINRKDFKVGGGSLIMSKNVKIEVVYSGTK